MQKKSNISRFSFAISARNENGEIQEEGEDIFVVHVDGPSGSIAADVQDTGKGEYNVSFKPTSSGTYKIRATLGEEHVEGSPFNVVV